MWEPMPDREGSIAGGGMDGVVVADGGYCSG